MGVAQGPEVIDVFLVDVGAVVAAGHLPAALLAETERRRAQRYRLERDRDEFTVGRLAVRLLIGARLDVAPGAVRLAVGPNGAPMLAAPAPAPISFNVSHASGVVALAMWVGEGCAAGVDVEAIASVRSDPALPAAVLTAAELVAYRATPGPRRDELLTRHWTAKEAYLKAIRLGLGREPNVIAVGPWRGDPHTVDLDGRRWAFHPVDAGATHVATVATDDVRAVVDARWWSDTMIHQLARWRR
jgi:4'-phosphopantetheinyl transferase